MRLLMFQSSLDVCMVLLLLLPADPQDHGRTTRYKHYDWECIGTDHGKEEEQMTGNALALTMVRKKNRGFLGYSHARASSDC
jgi:hypothetical protein